MHAICLEDTLDFDEEGSYSRGSENSIEAHSGEPLSSGVSSSTGTSQTTTRKHWGCRNMYNYSGSLPRMQDQKTYMRMAHLTAVLVVAIILVGFLGHKYFENYVMRKLHYGHTGSSGVIFLQTQREPCVCQAEWTHVKAQTKHLGMLRLSRRLANTSFELPRNSSLLYFISNGGLAKGSFRITDDGMSGVDVVQVDVSVTYDMEKTLSSLTMCLLQRSNDQNGIGIFSLENTIYHQAHFDIRVRLPSSRDNQVSYYGDIETSLPRFSHEIDDIMSTSVLSSLTLRTTESMIRVKSIFAREMNLFTTNGPIEGNMGVSDQLPLQTENGHIRLNTSVHAVVGADTSSIVDLRSINGSIAATINLVSYSRDYTGGTFDVNAETENAPIDLTFPVAPVDPMISLSTKNTNSSIRVALPQTFDGRYILHASGDAPPVTKLIGGDYMDFSGKVRRRYGERRWKSPTDVEGLVHWLPRGD